jgi:hypothetical protein
MSPRVDRRIIRVIYESKLVLIFRIVSPIRGGPANLALEGSMWRWAGCFSSNQSQPPPDANPFLIDFTPRDLFAFLNCFACVMRWCSPSSPAAWAILSSSGTPIGPPASASRTNWTTMRVNERDRADMFAVSPFITSPAGQRSEHRCTDRSMIADQNSTVLILICGYSRRWLRSCSAVQIPAAKCRGGSRRTCRRPATRIMCRLHVWPVAKHI